MLAGVYQESNTSIHFCEEIAGVPYHLQKEMSDIYITDYSEDSILVKNYLHNWYKPAMDFNKLDGLFKSNGIMKAAKIGNSTVRLINAKHMFEFTVDLLKKSPVFLIK